MSGDITPRNSIFLSKEDCLPHEKRIKYNPSKLRGDIINILVIGAGAIGCLVGGRLSLSGHHVTLLGRQSLMDAVQSGGLQLQWHDGRTETAHPAVVDTLDDIVALTRFELILVTVKSFDTAAAVAPLTGKISAPTQLLSLQNGVGNEECLADLFPDTPVLAGSITFPVTIPQPGTVFIAKDTGAIGLASATKNADPSSILTLLLNAGFDTRLFADARALKWSKLLMNIISNAIPAILDMSPAESLADNRIFQLEMEAVKETLAVMHAAKISPTDVPGYPVRWLARAMRWLPMPVLRIVLKPKMVGGRGDKLPSLMLDMRRGRNQSEVNVLNKMVADTGQHLHVPTPVNTTISEILNGILDGSVESELYRQNPDALWQAVQSAKTGNSVGG